MLRPTLIAALITIPVLASGQPQKERSLFEFFQAKSEKPASSPHRHHRPRPNWTRLERRTHIVPKGTPIPSRTVKTPTEPLSLPRVDPPTHHLTPNDRIAIGHYEAAETPRYVRPAQTFVLTPPETEDNSLLNRIVVTLLPLGAVGLFGFAIRATRKAFRSIARL